MKTINLSAAALAAVLSTFAVAVPALAQDGPSATGRGHYEWRAVPQFGPRAIGPTRVRVWVPAAAAAIASCDCAMMKASPADCGMRVDKPKHG